MPRYVAFLRAINVGGRRVKMEALKKHFEEMGFAKVSTFIASGNVLFESPETDTAALEKTIEAHLKASLGYAVETFLRTPEALSAIVAACPFDPEEGQTVHVLFLASPRDDAAGAAVEALETERDVIRVRGRDLYWLVRGKLTDSLLKPGALDRALKKAPATARNITMLRRLLETFA